MAEFRSGTFAFESTNLTYRDYEQLRDGGLEAQKLGLWV